MYTLETHQLFNKGLEAWNSWATKMLEQRRELRASGRWTDGSSNWNQETAQWYESAKADFSGVQFRDQVDFSQYEFPSGVSFEGAQFHQIAQFRYTKFGGFVDFSSAKFKDDCSFAAAKFEGRVLFDEVQFLSDASFFGSHFSGEVTFDKADFKGYLSFDQVTAGQMISFDGAIMSNTCNFQDLKCGGEVSFRNALLAETVTFKNSEFGANVFFDNCKFENIAFLVSLKFKGVAHFTAMTAKGLFLCDVIFDEVPNFSASHFDEAPQLDNVIVGAPDSRGDSDKTGIQDTPSRWRALKRLAIQGHDYERELQFFAGEIVSRRWTHDRWKDGQLWAGYLYQRFSDCGRSIGRPIVCLGIGGAIFALFYVIYSVCTVNSPDDTRYRCRVGTGDMRLAAVSLSIYNSVPFARVATPRQVEQHYACLYGVSADGRSNATSMFGEAFVTVPFGVAVAGSIQVLLSTILLFLIALSVRNHFKIK